MTPYSHTLTQGVFYKLVNYILFKGCLLDFVLLCHDSG